MTWRCGIVFACLVALIAGCSASRSTPGTGHALAPTGHAGQAAQTTGLTTFALYYQTIRSPADIAKLGHPNVIVTTPRSDDAAAARAIHASGAKAFRYVQAYWLPKGKDSDGLDIGKHPDWAFCAAGSRPLVGQVKKGRPWYYLDGNERAVRRAFAGMLRTVRSEGYDGVMFDRGSAALTGPEWDKVSTCTQDPVRKGATFSDAYVGLMSEVHKAGLKLLQNYGYSPFDPKHRFRPDPADPACRAGKFTTCRHIGDGFRYIDYFLDEVVAHPRDELFQNDYAANLENERNPRFGGKVVGLLTPATLGGNTSRAAVFFEFAKVRLFNMPLTAFTGDDRCHGAGGLCDRMGVYPGLTSPPFGRPFGAAPEKTHCVQGSAVRCVWLRQYHGGLSVANVSGRTVPVTIRLAVRNCRLVSDMYTGTRMSGGRCVHSVSLRLPPWSGRPLLFG